MTNKVEVEREDLERLFELSFKYLDATGVHRRPTPGGIELLSKHEKELLDVRDKYLGDGDE